MYNSQVRIYLASEDENTSEGSWYLEKLFVKKRESNSNATGIMWLVDVAAWLCLSNSGRQPSCPSQPSICRQPQAVRDAPNEIELSVMEGQPVKAYRIDIITGNQWRGGTDAHVLLDINAENVHTSLHMPWKRSATNKTPFKAGQHDVFLLDGKSNHNLPDIGHLTSLRLSVTDAKKFCWFVERVDFQDLAHDGLVCGCGLLMLR